MRRKALSILTLVLSATVFASCTEDVPEETTKETTAATTSETSEASEASEATGLVEGKTNTMYLSFDDPGGPELTGVRLSVCCSDALMSQISVTDLYGVNVLHSEVLGLVGIPLEIDYPADHVYAMEVEFFYDEDSLRGYDENHMSIIRYDEDGHFYVDVDNELDTEANTLTFTPEGPGVYMMIGADSWDEIFNGDFQEPDQSGYITDWERSADTGSIMELADTEWALMNAPVFTVENVEQLASVVWYVNSFDDYVTVDLQSDIDLEGYDWVPMGTSQVDCYGFSGCFYGNGHTISNMSITSSRGGGVGFIGYSKDLEVYDLNIVDASITGGGSVGILGGEVIGGPYISNVNVSGEINDYYNDAGGILGHEVYAVFENCTARVTIDGEPCNYLSARLQYLDEADLEEVFEVTMDDTGLISRTSLDDESGYDNLTWHIERNGSVILDRLAYDEMSFNLFTIFIPESGDTYTVYLTYFNDYTYVRCSNIAEVTIE